MVINRRIKIFGLPLIIFLMCLLTNSAFAQCPSPEEVSDSFGRFAARGSQIIAINPTAYAGVCEVCVRLQARTRIFYVGSKGDFILMGQLYDAATGSNLTRDSLEAISLFSVQEMDLLKKLTAFSLGNTDTVLITSPTPNALIAKRARRL